MAHIKTVLVSGVVALVVALLAVFSFGGGETVREIVKERTLGAAAGPDIISPYLRWGGVATYRSAQAMNSATTTVCALRAPRATSTLESFIAATEVSSTSAVLATLALSGVNDEAPSASTTALVTFASVAANAKGLYTQASSTVVNPGQWVVLTFKGGSGTFSPTGSCQATWQSL